MKESLFWWTFFILLFFLWIYTWYIKCWDDQSWAVSNCWKSHYILAFIRVIKINQNVAIVVSKWLSLDMLWSVFDEDGHYNGWNWNALTVLNWNTSLTLQKHPLLSICSQCKIIIAFYIPIQIFCRLYVLYILCI